MAFPPGISHENRLLSSVEWTESKQEVHCSHSGIHQGDGKQGRQKHLAKA